MRIRWLPLLFVSTVAAAGPCPPADVTSWSASVIGGKLAFCNSDTHTCWIADSAWSSAPMPAAPAVTVGPKELVACAADGKTCAHVATTAYPGGGEGVANDDRTLIAVRKGATIDVYDTASGKRITTVKGWKSPAYSAKDAEIQQVRFLGKTLAVWETWTPVTAAARLFDARKGKKIGDVGKAGTELDTSAALVHGDEWAFSGFDGKLYVENVATGKMVKQVALGGEPGIRVAAGTLADGRVVVMADTVSLVDVATGKVAAFVAPVCKP